MRIYAWQSLLQPDGYINEILLVPAHRSPHRSNWLAGQPITVILGLVYGYIPYMILPLFGNLDRIDQSLLEAGRDLGASPWRTFRRVTLPLSKQAILAASSSSSLPMFGDYYTNNLLSASTKTSMFGNLIDTSIRPGQGRRPASLVLILMIIADDPDALLPARDQTGGRGEKMSAPRSTSGDCPRNALGAGSATRGASPRPGGRHLGVPAWSILPW